MRSSLPEGQHAPRAKQAPPSGSSGAAAGHKGAPLSRTSTQPRNTSSSNNTSTTSSLVQRSQDARLNNDQANSSPPTNISNKTSPGKGVSSTSKNNNHSPKTSPQALSKQPGNKNLKQGSSTSTKTATSDSTEVSATPPNSNFAEYDDQEWDVGVGHLIIDLDADIAQADRGRMSGGVPPSGTLTHQGTPGSTTLEDKHSLKMKIKRTKPTKTSEAKHEIVKTESAVLTGGGSAGGSVTNNSPSVSVSSSSAGSAPTSNYNGANSQQKTESIPVTTTPVRTPTSSRTIFKDKKRRLESMNGSVPSPPATNSPSRVAVPPTSAVSGGTSTGTSVPQQTMSTSFNSHNSSATSVQASSSSSILSSQPSNSNHSASGVSSVTQVKNEIRVPVVQNSVGMGIIRPTQDTKPPLLTTTGTTTTANPQVQTERLSPASKRLKTDGGNASCSSSSSSPATSATSTSSQSTKRDACVGTTSVGTITEPDCLGPCEPGSSVTLEGIVWHETEGGVLVVNVTWRGKTYVGTLLDCTKHDWAPPSVGNECNGDSGNGRTGSNTPFRNGGPPSQMRGGIPNGRR